MLAAEQIKGARGYKFEIIEMGVDTEDSHIGKGSLQEW
jgi:hypothetical protein